LERKCEQAISNEEYEFDFEQDVDFENITFPKITKKK
jgi:hypothetical protein